MNAFCIIGTAVIPLSVNVYMLAVVIFFDGITTGSLDSGMYNYISA